MSRPAERNKTPEVEIVNLPEAWDPAKFAQMKREQRLVEFAGGLPGTVEAVLADIRYYLEVASEGIIEAGRRLLILKEKVGYGTWVKYIESLGLTRRTASNFMAVAAKVGGRKALTHLPKSKLYALLDVPDDELQELEEEGKIADLTLDDIDRMSVRELKERVRRLTKKEGKKQAESDEQASRIAELVRENQRLKHNFLSAAEEEAAERLYQLHDQFNGIAIALENANGEGASEELRERTYALAAWIYHRSEYLLGIVKAQMKIGYEYMTQAEIEEATVKFEDTFGEYSTVLGPDRLRRPKGSEPAPEGQTGRKRRGRVTDEIGEARGQA